MPVVFALLVFPVPVGAWPPSLQIFSDAALTQSGIEDNAPRIVSLYVVESGTGGATGVSFSIEPTAGFTGVWLGDASAYSTFGNSQTSISIGYGSCYPLPVLALTMTYQLFGTSAPCSELRLAPPAGLSCVLSPDMDCAFVEACIRDVTGLAVNCGVATEASTWGRVKALFR